MPIDRTQYNLLADDDGSNTVGTRWTKNIVKTVLLDPIDTELATKAPLGINATGTTSSATPTPTIAGPMNAYDLTAQAAAAAFANPTGTPVNFDRLIIRIKDNGTARALTWGSAYVAGGVALPSTTVLSKILTLGFIYNTANGLNKWQLVAASQEA